MTQWRKSFDWIRKIAIKKFGELTYLFRQAQKKMFGVCFFCEKFHTKWNSVLIRCALFLTLICVKMIVKIKSKTFIGIREQKCWGVVLWMSGSRLAKFGLQSISRAPNIPSKIWRSQWLATIAHHTPFMPGSQQTLFIYSRRPKRVSTLALSRLIFYHNYF